MVINDLSPHVVVRNVIITLLALAAPDDARTVECMLHVWYSAFITSQDVDLLREKVHPLVLAVVDSPANAHMPAMANLAHTWKFGSNTCRLEMEKGAWIFLKFSLSVAHGLSFQDAQHRRSSVTLANERRDYFDRFYNEQSPSARVCMQRYREDGLLLPFGAERSEFKVPNPYAEHPHQGAYTSTDKTLRTFFQLLPQYFGVHKWPLNDGASPLSGWDLQELVSSNLGPATNDIYGKLHHHVKHKLSKFVARLQTQKFAFHFLNVDADELCQCLGDQRFDRIESANIADNCYLGVGRVLEALGPLLRGSKHNPNATLITLFMNAIPAMAHQFPDRSAHGDATQKTFKYYKISHIPTTTHDPTMISVLTAKSLLQDSEKYFSRYYSHLLRPPSIADLITDT